MVEYNTININDLKNTIEQLLLKREEPRNFTLHTGIVGAMEWNAAVRNYSSLTECCKDTIEVRVLKQNRFRYRCTKCKKFLK